MKLRNKKTGEIDDYEFVIPKEKGIICLTNGKSPAEDIWEFDNLAELLNYFEDYTPAEPLIKDEKIRKAVRAWAEANDIGIDETVLITKPTFDGKFLDIEYGMLNLSFIYDDDSIANKAYFISELCGKKEE